MPAIDPQQLLQAVNTTQIGDIANWAAIGKLKRQDILQDAIEAAASIYQVTCKKVPFDELRHTSTELSLNPNTASYDISTIVTSGGVPITGICSVRLQQSTGRYRRLRRSHVRTYDGLGSYIYTVPATYARWGGQLEFNPGIGSSGMTFRMRYWGAPVLNFRDMDALSKHVLLTPPEWDELFKWETYWRMLIHLDQYEKAAMLMQSAPMPRQQSPRKTMAFETAIIPRLWNDLLTTIDQRENVDEDFSINPVIRPYTR